jgi:plasmid stabilization system protein ParE
MRRIDHYLGDFSPAVAVATLEGIMGQVAMLGAHPRIGGRLPKWDPRELRVKLYGKYQIIYEVISEDIVLVHAVFHGSMDMDQFQF